MNNLYNELAYARFDLNLPISDDHNNIKKININNVKYDSFIPKSMIATQLKNNLISLMIIENNDQDICNEIMLAFRLLYNKYVDSKHSVLCINISSDDRQLWIKLVNGNTFNHSQSIINKLNSIIDSDSIQLTIKKCVTTAEPSVVEVGFLLTASFARFCSTPEYQKLSKNINSEY